MLGDLADCRSPAVNALEDGSRSDMVDCSSPKVDALEAALEADDEKGLSGDRVDCSALGEGALGDLTNGS